MQAPDTFVPAGPWRTLAWLLPVLALAAAFNAWVLDPRHFFFADDWGWLWRSQFESWRETIHLLPTSIYNDRPGGELAIRGMYELFWLRAGPYNLAWLCAHLANCAILAALLARILPPVRVALATLLAGCWFSTLTAVHWVGAVFDLLAATWCLLAVLTYVQAGEAQQRNRRWLHAGLALLFHLLAIRTKELALALVVALAAWDWLCFQDDGVKARLRRLAPHIALTLFFMVVYAHLYAGERQQFKASPYELSLSPSRIIEGVGYYFAQAFYAFAPGSQETNIGVGLGFAALVVAISCASRAGIASLLSAIALCAAVLLLSRQRHPLYLYVPHFFIAAAICSAFPRSRVATWALVVAIAVLLGWPAKTGYLRDARHFVLLKGAYSQSLFYDYARRMQDVRAPRQVKVAVAETYFDPFSWGPGSAIQLYHRNPDIQVEVTNASSAPETACEGEGVLCFRERDGRLLPMR